MKPIYRYRYPPYTYLLYRNDTDIPHIPHTEPIPIPSSYHFFHTDTDTGYRYLVSVPGICIIPGIGRTLIVTDVQSDWLMFGNTQWKLYWIICSSYLIKARASWGWVVPSSGPAVSSRQNWVILKHIPQLQLDGKLNFKGGREWVVNKWHGHTDQLLFGLRLEIIIK